MKIVLLGCPGAGKGTQSKVLSARYDLAHIATGEIFRGEIANKTELGQKAADYVRRGMLVPDSIVTAMVSARLDGTPGAWLLDGYPRTLEQARSLDQYLVAKRHKLSLVFYLAMVEAEVLRRLTGRRNCKKCGALYNLASHPPQAEGKCDACQGELVQREDDTEGTVRKRLMVYEDLTQPLVAYYRAEHEFHQVDGGQPPEAVTSELAAVIDRVAAGAR